MDSLLGSVCRVQVFGQSHSEAIGCVIEGLPAGFLPDWEKVKAFMARRAPNGGETSTSRREKDEFEILSGLNEKGETCGAPLCMCIRNTDCRGADYDSLKDVPRPGHADFAASVKYGGHNDLRGGGQFSGRLTAPLCFAGALALQLLEKRGIRVKAHIYAIDGVADEPFDFVHPQMDGVAADGMAVLSPRRGEEMTKRVLAAKAEGDSVGGIVECACTGLPAGLGGALFEGVESRLARAFFGIPAVRGVEFGAGFASAAMRGSAHNDAFTVENGQIKTQTNNHSGILGGITTSMPVIARVAFKPTPSVAKEQESVSLSRAEAVRLSVGGRHDPCVVPRAVPAVEAVMAWVMLDLLMESGAAAEVQAWN